MIRLGKINATVDIKAEVCCRPSITPEQDGFLFFILVWLT